MTVATALSSLDETWLDEVLDAGGTITAIAAEPLAFTGATTDLARIRITYAGAPSGPTSVIAKIRGISEVQQQMDLALGLYEREARFYAELAAAVPVNSPHCFHVGNGDTTPLLLEDLDGLRMGDQLAGLSVAEAETLMGTLAALHTAHWESRVLEAPWLLRHDIGAFPSLVGMLVGSGAPALEKQFGDRTPEPVLRGVLSLCARWGDLIVVNATGPHTLVHNDCRLDNIFFAPDGTPTLIDWQIVSRTRGAQDVANLLAGSMRADDLSAHWERLLRLYHGSLRLHGVTGYSLDELIDHYRANVFYPLGAGLALLGAMAIGDARSLGEEIVARCLRHIEEIDALSVVSELTAGTRA
jgi:hypothetical protein